MLTCYPGGESQYVTHVDNEVAGVGAPGGNARRLTAILYTNARWSAGDGGELRLLDAKTKSERAPPRPPRAELAPRANRLVLFWADERTPHAVLPTTAPRYAVTIWSFDSERREQIEADRLRFTRAAALRATAGLAALSLGVVGRGLHLRGTQPRWRVGVGTLAAVAAVAGAAMYVWRWTPTFARPTLDARMSAARNGVAEF